MHNTAIQAFARVWKPEIHSLVEFGDQNLPYNSVWPDMKLLNKFPPSKKMKLKAISYSQYLDCLFLNGM